MAGLADTALMTLSTQATDPRARGLAAGSALAEPAALSLAAYLPLFASGGHDLDDVRRFGARVLERAASWHPPLAVELEAFALGARLEPELVGALNGRTELLALAECTTVGCCASAEGPWLAQNWDWYADDSRSCLVWSAAVEGGARFATMTEAGVLAKVGVSTRGIAVALNILYHASDGTGRLGVPVHLVLRRLLEQAASTGDAWELLRETPYSASSCVTVVDAAGDGACFELSPAGVARIEPRDGLLAHTNHFLDDALAGDEAAQPAAWLPGSRARLATTRRAAPRGLGDALAVLADHTSDPQPICRHAEDPGVPDRPPVDTVVSLAMRPAVPELRVAAGQPCECSFLPYVV
jgi:isopenicillin-N N-acyltransferase-like protein